jgi:hypothetical protein
MKQSSIKQIPLPGNSGTTPTGAMQFQDDWPGLFIRGDDAIALLQEWREIQRALEGNGVPYFGVTLDKIAELIERDVVVRSEG